MSQCTEEIKEPNGAIVEVENFSLPSEIVKILEPV